MQKNDILVSATFNDFQRLSGTQDFNYRRYVFLYQSRTSETFEASKPSLIGRDCASAQFEFGSRDPAPWAVCGGNKSTHYNDVIMTSLKSPASPLFTQLFIRAQIKENIKAPRHWPLCGEFTGDRFRPKQNGHHFAHLQFLSAFLQWKS